MILLTIRMQAAPGKRKELLQAVTSLVRSVKKMDGCHRYDLCCNMEDDDELCLLGEWESQEDLDAHLGSELFKVLLGAMSLLKSPQEMKLFTGLALTRSADMAGEVSASRPLLD